ncbi:MAG: hypothetical protein J6B87_07370 [Clostridia bacterium]|nr:hypothetical protein [Clostridia bacterium]
MRRVRTFVDYLIVQAEAEWRGEHKRNGYNSIYGKIIYPVAINPLDFGEYRTKYDFNKRKGYYEMIR